MEQNKKSAIVKSPAYREFLGKELRKHRIDGGYTLLDVSVMTGIPVNTLLGIEKGKVTNLDYYVEYGKAVKYPLATLRQAKIKLEPAHKLPKEQLKRIKLTKEIRDNIVLTDFLSNGKSSQQIKDELERLKVIPIGVITTTEIAGVMRNLIADDVVTIESKVGNKNTYIVNR